MSGKITQWSYSRWKTYCECPRKAKFSIIDRIRQPGSPAMERGTAIHKAAEDYLKGARPDVAPELHQFASYIADLRECGASAEGEFAFTTAWEPTTWFHPSVWARVKLDASLLQPDGMEFVVVDYKTGRKYDDHAEQLRLYGLAALLEQPTAKTVLAQDWYLDLGEDNVLEERFARSDEKALRKDWERKTTAMLSDTIFAPTPSHACSRCPYRKVAGGPCEF